ncbi:MAG TPA: DUF5069 domain-containing protein [Candidatus Baltobacteraceae bacterium]|nr:DUF5069 domain-containing protein [Candidatus Baltobacteraceae bacterium]
MDLTKEYPRSPREQLEGIATLPRAVDKARAQLAGTLGEYVYYGCRFNRKLFDTLGVTDDEFLDAVRTAGSDDGVAEWIRDFVRPEGGKVEQLNAWVENNAPAPSEREEFCSELERVDPGNDSVTTWTELVDLEEGRIKKESSTAT